GAESPGAARRACRAPDLEERSAQAPGADAAHGSEPVELPIGSGETVGTFAAPTSDGLPRVWLDPRAAPEDMVRRLLAGSDGAAGPGTRCSWGRGAGAD